MSLFSVLDQNDKPVGNSGPTHVAFEMAALLAVKNHKALHIDTYYTIHNIRYADVILGPLRGSELFTCGQQK